MANHHPTHFVVDGSNIATEGRSQPSLAQLNEAVLAFMKQYPGSTITVIVDATFGHRIDQKETKAFDEAVANNELVAPPAGAIGRGDAFVLAIADQADAGILSNDSFQEFHGDYEWLFDEGRLVGGKPVPNVGWVFVDRTPVRGSKSRAAMKATRRSRVSPDELKSAKKQAANRVRKKGAAGSKSGSEPKTQPTKSTPAKKRPAKVTKPSESHPRHDRSKSGAKVANYVNELLPFIEFVEHFPVGSPVAAIVDRYSSHGAYLAAHDVSLYLPLQNIAEPPPSSARSVLKVGEEVTAFVVGFQPDRRSIDVALPERAPALLPGSPDSGGRDEVSRADTQTDNATGEPATGRRSGRGSAAQTSPTSTTGGTVQQLESDRPTVVDPADEQRSATEDAANTASSQLSATKQTVSKKAPAKKTAAKKTPAKKTAAKKTPARKTAAKKTAAKKTAAKKTPAKKTAAKKTPAKKTAAKKTPAKKTPAKKTAAKKSATAKKSAAAKKPPPAK